MTHFYKKINTCLVLILLATFGFTSVAHAQTVTDNDGNEYTTVTIGDQIWTTTHLYTTTYANGDSIPYVEFPAAWVEASDAGEGIRVNFSNNVNFGLAYGYLYNGHVASDTRNACPDGMRVPTDMDWQKLEAFAGMPEADLGRAHNVWGGDTPEANPAGKLKSTLERPDDNPAWNTPNKDATDEFGFAWLPGSTRFAGGAFPDENSRFAYGQIWTSTDVNGSGVRYLARFDRNGIRRQVIDKANGAYIRCVADVTTTSNEELDNRPGKFALDQNYPNPFNPNTVISFSVPQVTNVKLTVYDMLGRVVSVLVNDTRSAGTHEVNFDASNLSSGIYMYQIQAGTQTMTRMMTLMK